MADMIPIRSDKHVKRQELIHLKSVYKMLPLGHHYLEISYLSQNL